MARTLMALARASKRREYEITWPPKSRDGRRILRGLEDRSDATAVGLESVTGSQNMYYRGGAMTRRGGIATWLLSALATPVRSFGFSIYSGGNKLIAFTNKTAYSISTTQNLAATDLTAGFTVDAAVSSEMYLGRLYCVNGTDFRYYDPAAGTWTSVTSAGGAGNDFANAILSKYMVISHDRVILAGNAAAGHTVYVSEVSDPTTFKTANEISCDSGDGTVITTLENFDDWCLVGKPYSLFTFQPALIGTSSFQLYEVSKTFGIPSPDTAIVWADGLMIFQSFDGHVYALSRNALNKEFIRPVLLSQRIAGTINGINKANLSTAQACIHNGFYKLNVDGKELWLDLLNSDLRNGENCIWSPMKWSNNDQPVRFVRPDNGQMYAGGAAADGQVYQHDNGNTDSGTQMTWFAYTPWLDANKPEMQKLLQRFWVFFQPNTSASSAFSARIQGDQAINAFSVTAGGTSGFVLGVSKLSQQTLGLSNENQGYQNSTGGNSRRFRFLFQNSTDNGPITIRGLSMYLRDIGPS